MTKSSISALPGHPAHGVVGAPGALNHLRGDHLIGAMVSLSVILGVVWLGEMTKGASPKSRAKPQVDTIQFMVMPWIEPDTPEVAQKDVTKPAADLRPPMLPDVPQLGMPDTFVQPLEPPPPGPVGVDGGLIAIPAGPGRLDYGGKIFDPSQLDRQPVPISQTRPNYPFEMRRNDISGQVVVDFIVDAGGHVDRALAASSSNREFESAAVSAVSKWRFQPGRKAGHAVNTHMQVPVVFTLNPDS
jgi:protein TonB